MTEECGRERKGRPMDDISPDNTLAEPEEIEWCYERALAFKGHGLCREHMEEWAKILGWAELPVALEELRIVKVPDRTNEYKTNWHASDLARATPYTIAWCRPKTQTGGERRAFSEDVERLVSWIHE